jgi:hypothetical protein
VTFWQRRDKIGWTSSGKDVVGQFIGDRSDAWLHVEHRSATKGFVRDSAQPGVIRFVDGEHIVGEDAKSVASTSAARQPRQRPCAG